MSLEDLQNNISRSNNPTQLVTSYYEHLKKVESNVQICMNSLLMEAIKDPHIKMMCYNIIEEYLKHSYLAASQDDQMRIREFILQWIKYQNQRVTLEDLFLRKKAAQLISWTFVADYPNRWPNFFVDMLGTLNDGLPAVECYLRVLLAIHEKVGDVEVEHQPHEHQRNTIIKDTMRETCITDVALSWLKILSPIVNTTNVHKKLCLEVVGDYISWIDIGLIANNEFTDILLYCFSQIDLREAACDCLLEIIDKGMEPSSKTKLIEDFFQVLMTSGVLKNIENETDEDYLNSLALVINDMGVSLIECYSKVTKSGDIQLAAQIKETINSKVPFLYLFFNNDSNQVTLAVLDFAREYIAFLKQETKIGAYRVREKQNTETLLRIFFKCFKYTDAYNFKSEGQSEAEFDDFRKSLKRLFENIYQLDRELTITQTTQMIYNALNAWRELPFQEVEVALAVLLILGELAAAEEKVQQIFKLLFSSGVIQYDHISITLNFFAIVSRHDKIFNHQPNFLNEILSAFLSKKGIHHESCKIRSRTTYLFNKFIKNQRSNLPSDTGALLQQLQPSLNLHFNCEITPDEQLYLYEATASIILNVPSLPKGVIGMDNNMLLSQIQHKHVFLLQPVLEHFINVQNNLEKLVNVEEKLKAVELMCHDISIFTKTTKAFSTQYTMKSFGCQDIYLKALKTFLGALENITFDAPMLQSNIRQFLHRLVICIDRIILDQLVYATDVLLKNPNARTIADFISLLNQLVNKFKKELVPFLSKLFNPFVRVIFDTINTAIDTTDSMAVLDHQTLYRSYFTFLAALMAANIPEVIATQECVMDVLNTVLEGAASFNDPNAQKTCFQILKKMVECWGHPNCPEVFTNFMFQSIVPACFSVPLHQSFNLNDANSTQMLNEIISCMKTIYKLRGEELIMILHQYLPTVKINTLDYCALLRNPSKDTSKHFRMFFANLKS